MGARQSLTFFVGVLIALTVSGCWGPPTVRGPDRLYSAKIENSEMQALFPDTSETWKKYLRAPLAYRTMYRNEIIAARMYAIDVNYTEYEHALNVEGQSVEFWAKVGSATLTTVATAVPVAQTVRGLNAVAHGVDLATSAYDDAFFRKQLTQNLIASMRAARHERRAALRGRMTCGADVYPLGLALSDTESYYRAGAIETGLMRLARTATNDEQKAKTKDDVSGATAAPVAKATQQKADAAVAVAEANTAAVKACRNDVIADGIIDDSDSNDAMMRVVPSRALAAKPKPNSTPNGVSVKQEHPPVDKKS